VSEYEEYKHRSTVYRLVSVLGWIRAIRCELSSLEGRSGSLRNPVELAIEDFVNALADGSHVELLRLEQLARIWGLVLPTDKDELAGAAVVLDTRIRKGRAKASESEARDFSAAEERRICGETAGFITRRLGTPLISQLTIDETCADVMKVIGIREAWIYRDWQAALGDLVIRPVSRRSRSFEVIGFGEFEAMLLEGDEHQSRWLKRIVNLLDDVDVEREDYHDARVPQLRAMLRATASLLRALAREQPGSDIVSARTRSAAKKVLRELP